LSEFEMSGADAGSRAASNPHFERDLVYVGAPVGDSPLTVVLVHGRGLNPEYMIENVYERLDRSDLSYLLPAAEGDSWYPASFLAPLEQNEPRLSFALERLRAVHATLTQLGRTDTEIVWMGFSQGACLSAEYVARAKVRMGALVAFTGGLIGPDEPTLTRPKNQAGMPVLLTVSDTDPFVPVTRVNETAEIFRSAHADVTVDISHATDHVVTEGAITLGQKLLERVAPRH
jgi:phospholipase/carboxylesterase